MRCGLRAFPPELLSNVKREIANLRYLPRKRSTPMRTAKVVNLRHYFLNVGRVEEVSDR